MNAKEYMNLDIVPIDTLIGYEKIDELLRKDFRYLLLFSNLKKILKKQYGRQDFCITLGTRRFWVWGFMFENCNIYVLCHGEKGTAYEIDITGDSYKAKEEALKKIFEFFV